MGIILWLLRKSGVPLVSFRDLLAWRVRQNALAMDPSSPFHSLVFRLDRERCRLVDFVLGGRCARVASSASRTSLPSCAVHRRSASCHTHTTTSDSSRAEHGRVPRKNTVRHQHLPSDGGKGDCAFGGMQPERMVAYLNISGTMKNLTWLPRM